MKGRFLGTVKAEWLRNEGPDRLMRLIDSFTYIDKNNVIWTAQEGAVIDGASVPVAFQWLIGNPLIGDYRNASVIHDYYCKGQTRPHKEVHSVFCEMLKELGLVSWKRHLMCFAVKTFGPKWLTPQVEP